VSVVWIGFLVFVLMMVILDLGFFHRKARALSIQEALAWTGVWIVMALAFNILVFYLYDQNWFGWTNIPSHDLSGKNAAAQFFTGYLLEKSLSVDNIFVIAMVFAYFKVPLSEQHRVLYWGILGAVALRGIMIALGSTLLDRFDWIAYLFGGLLIVSAAKMLVMRHDNIRPNRNIAVRMTRRLFPVTGNFRGNRFFVSDIGVRSATPLFLAFLLVETANLMFAINSIPAIFSVTRDPFLIFTSNVFAILGLRALYFAVAGMLHRFRYLKMSLVFLLAFVGVQMMLSHHYEISSLVSLAVIGGIFGLGVLASVFAAPQDAAKLESPLIDDLEELATLSYREARRVVILIVGMTVVLLGIIMLALPFPGILTILLGLTILAIEFAWARRWLKRVRAMADLVQDRVRQAFESTDGKSGG